MCPAWSCTYHFVVWPQSCEISIRKKHYIQEVTTVALERSNDLSAQMWIKWCGPFWRLMQFGLHWRRKPSKRYGLSCTASGTSIMALLYATTISLPSGEIAMQYPALCAANVESCLKQKPCHEILRTMQCICCLEKNTISGVCIPPHQVYLGAAISDIDHTIVKLHTSICCLYIFRICVPHGILGSWPPRINI